MNPHRSLSAPLAIALRPLAALGLIAVLAAPAAADTWTSTAPKLALLDDATTAKSVFVDRVFKIRDVNVIVTLSHADTSQLRLRLHHPGGTVVTLVDGAAGTGFTHTVLDDEAASPLSGGTPYTASFQPETPLSAYDDLNSFGTWTLLVDDLVPGHVGELRSFSLCFNGRTYVGPDVAASLPIIGTVSYSLPVADDFAIADAEVTLSIRHTWTSDLYGTLLPPVGAEVVLLPNVGGPAGPNGGFRGTTIDDESTAHFAPAFPEFLGRFPPWSGGPPLSSLDGTSSAGSWSVKFVDNDPEDHGILDGWSLHLVPQPTCGGEAFSGNYAAGLAGTLGVPELSSDDPVLGEVLHLTVGNSSGVPAPALLLGGFNPANVPFKGGALLVSPSFQISFFTVPTSLTLNALLPTTQGLCGQHLYLQTLQADPGAPAGVALSRGLDLFFGS